MVRVTLKSIIMELNIQEMQEIQAGYSVLHGIGCGISVVALGLAFAGLVTATGGAGLLIAAASYSIAPAGVLLSCAPI